MANIPDSYGGYRTEKMSVPCVLTESMIRGLEPGDVVVSVNLEGDWRGQRPETINRLNDLRCVIDARYEKIWIHESDGYHREKGKRVLFMKRGRHYRTISGFLIQKRNGIGMVQCVNDSPDSRHQHQEDRHRVQQMCRDLHIEHLLDGAEMHMMSGGGREYGRRAAQQQELHHRREHEAMMRRTSPSMFMTGALGIDPARLGGNIAPSKVAAAKARVAKKKEVEPKVRQPKIIEDDVVSPTKLRLK